MKPRPPAAHPAAAPGDASQCQVSPAAHPCPPGAPSSAHPSHSSEWERALEDPDALCALYSPSYLRQCSGPTERQGRIRELKRRIEARAYRIDCDRIAEELLLRGDLKS